MTYCLAMRLNRGLVFMSDTRTNAGVDDVNTYRKLHTFQLGPDRTFVLQAAGNLATTQEVLDRLQVDLQEPGDHESLATVKRMFEAALYVGRVSRDVVAEHQNALAAVGANGTATFILGGQIAGGEPEIMMVYPEGNYIRPSEERPFLQIGETKYGKFMLEVAVEAHADLTTASKIAISSMMSTARANLSVGPPYDLAIYRNDAFELDQLRLEEDSDLLLRLQELWRKHFLLAVADLPSLTETFDKVAASDPDGSAASSNAGQAGVDSS